MKGTYSNLVSCILHIRTYVFQTPYTAFIMTIHSSYLVLLSNKLKIAIVSHTNNGASVSKQVKVIDPLEGPEHIITVIELITHGVYPLYVMS